MRPPFTADLTEAAINDTHAKAHKCTRLQIHHLSLNIQVQKVLIGQLPKCELVRLMLSVHIHVCCSKKWQQKVL